jgi:hypothetical protein
MGGPLEGIAMISRENPPPSYPFVDAAIEAIAHWVTRYRNLTGFEHESGPCNANEVLRMADDIGVTPRQLQELAGKGATNADLLRRMLVALRVDPEVIAGLDPLVMREMKWLCISCVAKKQCQQDLADGTAAEHFHDYCPNAVSIDELLDPKGRPFSY